METMETNQQMGMFVTLEIPLEDFVRKSQQDYFAKKRI